MRISRFPVGKSPADVRQRREAQTDTTSAAVLICEDEVTLRELIRVSLGSGFRFLEAESGTEALELIRRHRPDAVVLDVMLPGMNGLDVLREIRADGAISTTRVVAVSAWIHLEGEALAAGADSFIAKPFDPDVLRARVEELLGPR
jgi:two-component system OmpR family response regulator